MDDRRLLTYNGEEELVQLPPFSRRASFFSSRTSALADCGYFFLFALTCAVGCSRPEVASIPPPLVLRVGVAEAAASSGDVGVSQFIKMLSLEGLTQVNPDGRVVPRLADSWRWEADGLRLRLFLRPMVRFHDETQLTAQRAAKLLTALASDPSSWASYPSLEQVIRFFSEGDDQLVVDLRKPSAFLLEDLSVAIRGDGTNVGTGPYRVASSNDREVVLNRFDGYHLGTPEIAQVIVRPFNELRTTWASLLRRELDMVTDVPANSVQFIQNDGINVLPWHRWYQFVVAFNSEFEALRLPEVRRALNIAIDRETLIRRVLQGFATPSHGPIWPAFWAYDGSVPPYVFDQSVAKSLLDASGYTRGRANDGTGNPDTRLRFRCVIPAGYSVIERIGLEIQRQLYEIGVDVQFDAVPADQFESRLRSRKFEAVLVDMISGPSLGRPYLFWRSARNSQGLNVFGYQNADVDVLFEALQASTNDAVTRSATRRLQRAFLDDPPALFLAWNARARAVRAEFKVYQEPGRDPLSTLWRWTPDASLQNALAP